MTIGFHKQKCYCETRESTSPQTPLPGGEGLKG